MDPNQFAIDELLKSVDPNQVIDHPSEPMTGSSNQAMMANSNQVMMEVPFSWPFQTMMENSSHYMMETDGPMGETATGDFAVQVTT